MPVFHPKGNINLKRGAWDIRLVKYSPLGKNAWWYGFLAHNEEADETINLVISESEARILEDSLLTKLLPRGENLHTLLIDACERAYAAREVMKRVTMEVGHAER